MMTKEEVCKIVVAHDGCRSGVIMCTKETCPYYVRSTEPCHLSEFSTNIVPNAKKELKRIKLEKLKEILQ